MAVSIKVRELHFAYRDFSLRVDHLTFEISKITAIVGPNGAGKTTLLKCLGAVLPVKKGQLYLEGRDLSGMSGPDRARHISYVPQEHGSVFNYSVLDFVLMGRAAHLPLFAVPSEKDVLLAEKSLAFVGLKDYAARHFFQLSSGERRLVLIARALAQQADILLLDEPTTFLDPKHELEILELLRRLADEKNKTVLVTLHNLEMAARYADELVFMKQGAVFAAGKPGDIPSESLLEDVYGLRMRVIDLDDRRFIIR